MVRRIVWLTALALIASCGGDPAPKDVENPATVHRKKKKKKKPVEVAEAKDESSSDEDSKEAKRKKQDEEDAKEAEARRERQRKREQEEAAKEADEQAVSSDQGGDSSESSDDTEKKSDDEDEDSKKDAAEEKKRKREEAAEKKKEAAEEKKRKREEAAEKKKEAAQEKKRKKEEAAEEAKAKKEAAAEEAKAKKDKKKKHSEDVEEASSDDESSAKSDDETSAKSDDESADEDQPKKAKKTKGKAKKTVAAKDKKSAKKKKDKDEDDEAKDDEADKEEKPDKADKEVAKAEEPEEDEKSTLGAPDPENESKELDLEGGAVPTRDTGDETPTQTAILAIDRRPLTAPKGKFDLHGGPRIAAITTTGPGAGGKMISTTTTSEGFGLGATYGVSDSIQVGIDYTLGLHPGSAKGPLSIGGAFHVTHSEKLDIALSAAFALDYLTTTDVTKVPPVTTTDTLKGLQVGIWARYHLGPKLSAFTGLPSTPGTATGLAGASGGLPPLPYHLSIGLGSKAAIAMELPVGVAYQASPKLYTFAMTSLGHLGMNNSPSAFIFADYIPFSVGGFYANDSKLDVGAVLSDDVKQGLGYLRFDIVARYYLK